MEAETVEISIAWAEARVMEKSEMSRLADKAR